MPSAQAKLVGKRLKEWRQDRHWRLIDASRRLHVSIPTISQWEHALRFPSGEHLFRMAKVYRKPLCHLFCTDPAQCPYFVQGDGKTHHGDTE